MRSLIDRNHWWQERQRTRLLQFVTLLLFVVVQGYEITQLFAG